MACCARRQDVGGSRPSSSGSRGAFRVSGIELRCVEHLGSILLMCPGPGPGTSCRELLVLSSREQTLAVAACTARISFRFRLNRRVQVREMARTTRGALSLFGNLCWRGSSKA